MANTKIIVTGGTIDKTYMASSGTMGYNSCIESDYEGTRLRWESHLYHMMRQSNCTINYAMHLVCMKDSTELTIEDRDMIKDACINSSEKRIIILHGTDTMIETAHYLESFSIKKCIVLTGAFIPWSCNESDAMFNLGTAFAYSQMMPNGVHIAMNGRVFHPDMVWKNKEASLFESAIYNESC